LFQKKKKNSRRRRELLNLENKMNVEREPIGTPEGTEGGQSPAMDLTTLVENSAPMDTGFEAFRFEVENRYADHPHPSFTPLFQSCVCLNLLNSHLPTSFFLVCNYTHSKDRRDLQGLTALALSLEATGNSSRRPTHAGQSVYTKSSLPLISGTTLYVKPHSSQRRHNKDSPSSQIATPSANGYGDLSSELTQFQGTSWTEIPTNPTATPLAKGIEDYDNTLRKDRSGKHTKCSTVKRNTHVVPWGTLSHFRKGERITHATLPQNDLTVKNDTKCNHKEGECTHCHPALSIKPKTPSTWDSLSKERKTGEERRQKKKGTQNPTTFTLHSPNISNSEKHVLISCRKHERKRDRTEEKVPEESPTILSKRPKTQEGTKFFDLTGGKDKEYITSTHTPQHKEVKNTLVIT
jgi:hypothetical protein